jgi:DNA replication protein DnaC
MTEPFDALEEQRECQYHGQYIGKIFRVGERMIGGRCPVCMAEEKLQEDEREKRFEADRKRARIQQLMQRAMIPERFKNRTLENFVIENEGQGKAHRIATWYVDTWEERLANGTCLILSGNPGTGKTHISTGIGNAIVARGYPTLFSTVSDAMRSIKRSYDKDADLTESQAIDVLVLPSLLILDEVQMQQGSEHEKRLMFEVINKRYEAVKPTILLSNLGPEALKEYLGDRIMDRLREGGGKMVAFTWESKRV